jgi:hypothetical protein
VSLLIRDLEGGQGARLAACVSHVCAVLLPLAPADALEAAIVAVRPQLKEPGAHHPVLYFFKQILLRIEVPAFAVVGKSVTVSTAVTAESTTQCCCARSCSIAAYCVT